MTTPRIHAGLAIALLALGLAACSKPGETPADHSGADRAEGHTSSSAGLPAGHAEEGEKLANKVMGPQQKSCIGCHGAEGSAPIDETYPKIGGQYHDYIAYALQSYRDGRRDHAMMAGQAKELNDQQIADLAAYFGSRDSSKLHDLHEVH